MEKRLAMAFVYACVSANVLFYAYWFDHFEYIALPVFVEPIVERIHDDWPAVIFALSPTSIFAEVDFGMRGSGIPATSAEFQRGISWSVLSIPLLYAIGYAIGLLLDKRNRKS